MELPFKMIISNGIEKWRRDTFWTKEPETLEWIYSFTDGDVFFDVGANVGVYSLYCAVVHPNCKVWAFEPSPGNFDHLEKNIELNNFKNIFNFPWAIGDYEYCCGVFYENSTQIGDSGGQFGFNENLEGLKKVPVNGMTIDFIAWVQKTNPNHIKIDIDGQEVKVVWGMRETLKNPKLKSVLIEINENKIEIFKAFYDAGFTSDNKFNFLENHSRVRREKEGIKAENIIFTRREL